jgi:hypothetical protein
MNLLANSNDIETQAASRIITNRALKAIADETKAAGLAVENRGGRGQQITADKNECPHPHRQRAKAASAALPASQQDMLPVGVKLHPAAQANLAELAELYRELHNSKCVLEAVDRYMPKLKSGGEYFTDVLQLNHQQLEERLSALVARQLSGFYSARG